MKFKLLTKFVIFYFLLAAIGTTFIATFSRSMVYADRLAALESSLYDSANRLSMEHNGNFSAQQLSDLSNVKSLTEIALALNCDITAISKDGSVIYPASDADKTIANFDPTASDSHHGFSGNRYDYFDDDSICVYAPVVNSYQTQGYFILSQAPEALNLTVTQTLNSVYIAAFFVFATFLPLLLFIYLIIIRPVAKIQKASQEYSNGNLSYKLNYKSHDELGQLSESITFMASEIARTGEDQKKFVTNVSHDFRSPLTSIRGYIDAILDGTIPESMQSKYLNVVKDETERLTKLTQSLLDLNTISSDGTLLELTDFDVHHVIKKILATFEGRCNDKHIGFELSLAEPEFFVHADINKIQQVLYNLIDNAIKFSSPDSTIYIETTEKKGKAYISVKDEGIGISSENVKKIWDRFYKTDTSRGKDKKGLGLGLSITRDIIKAHGETIDVISTEGVGTEFIFSLPLAQN